MSFDMAIQLSSKHYLIHIPDPRFRNHSHNRILTLEVDFLLQMGTIEPVPTAHQGAGFYSTYFLVPKKTGGWPPILDLCHLNRLV